MEVAVSTREGLGAVDGWKCRFTELEAVIRTERLEETPSESVGKLY
jgi:hypothetical protein